MIDGSTREERKILIIKDAAGPQRRPEEEFLMHVVLSACHFKYFPFSTTFFMFFLLLLWQVKKDGKTFFSFHPSHLRRRRISFIFLPSPVTDVQSEK